MIKKTMLFLVILSVSLLIELSIAFALNNRNTLSIVAQRGDSKYQSIVNQAGLLTILYVGAEDNWIVTVVRKPQPGELPRYQMSFYHKINDKVFQKLYEYATVDRFQTAYVTIDRDRLFTVWTTGSAHRLQIFVVRDKSIKEVLSAGWKRDPEFVHLTKDNELEILIPSGEIADQEPKLAEIYQWNGKDYILVDKLPWADRLKGSKGTNKDTTSQRP